MPKSSSIAPSTRLKRRPISGPALVVLGLTLAGIWFGSQSLATTKTVTVDNANQPSTEPTEPSPTPDPTASAAPTTTDQPVPSSSLPAATSESATASSSLPAGFPSAIPAPANGTLTGSFGSESDGKHSYVVSYSVPAKAGDVAASYRRQLEQAGFTIDELPGLDFGGEGGAFYGAKKETISLTASVAPDNQQPGSTVVTVNATVE